MIRSVCTVSINDDGTSDEMVGLISSDGFNRRLIEHTVTRPNSESRPSKNFCLRHNCRSDPNLSDFTTLLSVAQSTLDTMLGLRTATRASQALPAFRNTAARRWASSGAEFKGAADNAFNRERAAVKQHAADTSGKWREKRGEMG
jgi:hypothetical protein